MSIALVAEIEAIKQLKARYFRLMDTKQWQNWASVFADDAVIGPLDTGVPGVTMGELSVSEFVSHAAKGLDGVTTIHHGHMPEIQLTSEDTARGIWSMEDLLVYPDGFPMRRVHGRGHYHETYTKVDGDWRIQSMQISRLHVEIDEG